MATTTQSTIRADTIVAESPPFEHSPLKISRYEQVASWLIALLAISGVVTGALLLVWWGSTNRYHPPMYNLTLEEEEGYGRGDRKAGFARDEKGPGDPEVPMLEEPAGSELFDQTEPLAVLSFAEEAVSSTLAEFGDVAATSTATASNAPGFGGTGGGEGGLGDNRPPGPLGDGVYVIPRYERWEMRFTSSSMRAYAAQLDSFGIELAAVGRRPQIDYVLNLTKSPPDKRSGPSKTEKRLYMAWKGGALQAFDRSLLTSAGIETAGRLLVQFYPPEIENTLARLEVANAAGRSKREFLKTVFGVRTSGRALEFYVIEQRFRSAPKG